MELQIYSFPIDEIYANNGKENYKRLGINGYRIGPFYCAKSGAHKGAYENAIDFLVRVKTPTVAVFDGVVVSFEDKYDQYGNNIDLARKANYILLRHRTKKGIELYSEYIHLEKDFGKKYNIYDGKIIKKGDVIGEVGLNGYMIYDEEKGPIPHLHFSIGIIENNRYKTIPIEFETKWFFNLYSFIDSFKEFVYGLINKLRIA